MKGPLYGLSKAEVRAKLINDGAMNGVYGNKAASRKSVQKVPMGKVTKEWDDNELLSSGIRHGSK